MYKKICIFLFSVLISLGTMYIMAAESPKDTDTFFEKYARQQGFSTSHYEGNIAKVSQQYIQDPSMRSFLSQAKSLDVLSYSRNNTNLNGGQLFVELLQTLRDANYQPLHSRRQHGKVMGVLYRSVNANHQELVIVNAEYENFKCLRLIGSFDALRSIAPQNPRMAF